MNLAFRLLRADEIDCRVASCSEYGVQLLLYKDARCDQNILDETVGPMNWQRKHTRDNANCIVSLWDDDKKQWIEKEDTGKESFTEAEKGLASDSFKRACFNWGIGRELYTAPQMFVGREKLKTLIASGNGKWTCKDYFTVTDIAYQDKKIVYVKIVNGKTGEPIIFGKNPNAAAQAPAPKAEVKKETDIEKMKISTIKVDALAEKAVADGVPLSRIVTLYKVPDIESMTEKQYKNCIDNWEKIKEMK